MLRHRKPVRALRTGLLGLAGLCLLLYAVSFAQVTWITAAGNSVGVNEGKTRIWYFDPTLYTARAPAGLHIGKIRGGAAVTIPSLGPSKRTVNTGGWGFTLYLLRAPPGGTPTVITLQSTVPLARLALVFGLPGGLLLLVPTRRRPGACPACGYDLQGLGHGVPCPECGRRAGPEPRGACGRERSRSADSASIP